MDLNSIKSPADIKVMSLTQLQELAADVRTALIEKLSKHGGHVGPNLGFVEATIAMHYVFDSPKDKIVYDVSHQSYIHKMLTGRMQAFTDPAHYDDVSGYTEPSESEHDFFTVGHTSTAVSMATGLAKARDLKGEDGNVIAVVGDGSLSGGEAFEGLDNGAVLHSNFIVVVNDNSMSIAHNHGGLYSDLHLLRSTRGQDPCNFFKALGFAYRFVADGNDLDLLIRTFKDVKDINYPVVVHVVTDKGRGYAPADTDKETWHWHVPFDIATGKPLHESTHENYSQITGDFLLKKMKEDPRVVAITSATPTVMGFTPDKRKEAGAQLIDVGIAEEQAAAMSSGLAKGGVRPFWGVYSSFVQRAYDQISQDIAINNNPAVIAVFMGTVMGMNDVTHLGWFDQTLLANIPNVVYLAPADRNEYLAMADWALRQTSHPVIIRVPDPVVRDLNLDVDTDYDDLNTYKMVRSGSDVAIIAAGNMLYTALQAADILKEKGINPTVINPRYLSGIDEEMLSAISPDHRAVITVEDAIVDGGFGQKVATFYGDRPMLVRNLGLKKEFADRYDASQLMDAAHLTARGIADIAVEMFK